MLGFIALWVGKNCFNCVYVGGKPVVKIKKKKKKKKKKEKLSQQKPLDPFTLKTFPKHCCHQPACILQGLVVSSSPVVLAWNCSGHCTDRHSLRLKTTPSLYGFVYRQKSDTNKNPDGRVWWGIPLYFPSRYLYAFSNRI